MYRYFGLLVVLAASGCVQQHQVVRQTPSSEGVQHKFEKNYTIDQKTKVSVGEAVVRVHDYYTERVGTGAWYVTPTENVTISGPVVEPLTFSTAKSYPVKGQISVDGVSYRLVCPVEGGHCAMVRPDGSIHNRVSTGGQRAIVVIYDMTVSPTSARMIEREELKVEERVSATQGNINYEILYSGVSNNALQFTYREYSPEGMARTAFYQNLNYPANAEFIRFKKFKIRVHSANSESIEYTVVEDGIER